MILIRLQGGLGNQLFQWALYESLKENYKVKLDKHIPGCTNRSYDLPDIISDKVDTISETEKAEFSQTNFITITDNHRYKNLKFKDDKNYYLNGYWQNEKYFVHIRNKILDSFKWPNLENLDFEDSCSIHVRRGDYLKYRHIYPVHGIEYYNRALDIINPKGYIYVFSDDIAWCKSNFKVKNMIFMKNNSHIQDLKYMSLCSDNIIANSSFSWWGAWLNQNRNKKVICPINWIKGLPHKDKDIKPEGWIQI
jgi:hypothetical protein